MVSWNALPRACAAVPGSFRSRRYRNIHFAGQFRNCETWVGDSTSARSDSWALLTAHLLPGAVNSQPDLAHVPASELELHPATCCIPRCPGRHIDRSRESLEHQLTLRRREKALRI